MSTGVAAATWAPPPLLLLPAPRVKAGSDQNSTGGMVALAAAPLVVAAGVHWRTLRGPGGACGVQQKPQCGCVR